MSRFNTRTGVRLHWRAIVRTNGTLDPSRASPLLAWHLVECANPTQDSAHCQEGQRLLGTGSDPDGHCLILNMCPRCAMISAEAAQPEAPATQLPS